MQGYLFSRPKELEEIVRLFPPKDEKATSAA
jgi:hypothetical protein